MAAHSCPPRRPVLLNAVRCVKHRLLPAFTLHAHKQIAAISNFGQLAQRSSLKKKEKEFNEIIQDAVPLIQSKKLNNELKSLQKEFDDILGRETQLKTKAAKIGPLVQNHSALQIQQAMRSKKARNAMKKARDTEATFKGVEDQMTKVEKKVSYLHAYVNEQFPEGLRHAVKKLQDRRSELVNRSPNMDRVLKVEELRKINQTEDHYKNITTKQKPGPKVQERVEQFGGAAYTPKKK